MKQLKLFYKIFCAMIILLSANNIALAQKNLRHGFNITVEEQLNFSEDFGGSLGVIAAYRFHQKYQAGIGAAADYYTLRSVPLFTDFRMDFHPASATPFIVARIGKDLPWLKDSQYSDQKKLAKNKAGAYGLIGIGEKFLLGAGCTLQASINYNILNLHTLYTMSADESHKVSYTFRRVGFNIGITL